MGTAGGVLCLSDPPCIMLHADLHSGPAAKTNPVSAVRLLHDYLPVPNTPPCSCREALKVLQEAAVLELVQPADSLADPTGPEQATLHLLPGGTGLQLTEADVAAAAGEAAAEAASRCRAAKATAVQMAVDAAAGDASGLEDEHISEALLLDEGAKADLRATAEPRPFCSGLSPALHTTSLPCSSPAVAAATGVVAARQPPLTLPLSLAIKWQRAPVQPSQAALRMLRPGAAAMLHALLVSRPASACSPCASCYDGGWPAYSVPASTQAALSRRAGQQACGDMTVSLTSSLSPTDGAPPFPQESPATSLPTEDLEGIARDFLECLAEVTAQPLPPTSITL